jgi:hypothetical protein
VNFTVVNRQLHPRKNKVQDDNNLSGDFPRFLFMADSEKWQRVGERVGLAIRQRGYKTVELFAHENGVDKSVLNRLIHQDPGRAGSSHRGTVSRQREHGA